MIEIAIAIVPDLHTVGDSTLAESSTGNTRLAGRLLTEICRFFIAKISRVLILQTFFLKRHLIFLSRQLDGIELNALIYKPQYTSLIVRAS